MQLIFNDYGEERDKIQKELEKVETDCREAGIQVMKTGF
jgi:hypothetical protein